MEAFDDLGLWILQNLGNIGFTGAMAIFIYLLVDGKLLLGREAQDGKEALKTLVTVNEKLVEFRVAAAQQSVRDEFGKRDLESLRHDREDLSRRLDQCHNDLDRCLDRPPDPEPRGRRRP